MLKRLSWKASEGKTSSLYCSCVSKVPLSARPGARESPVGQALLLSGPPWRQRKPSNPWCLCSSDMPRSEPDIIVLTPFLPLPVKGLSKTELNSSTFVHAHIPPWWAESVGRHGILQPPIMGSFTYKKTQGDKDTLGDNKAAMELRKYNKMGQEINLLSGLKPLS